MKGVIERAVVDVERAFGIVFEPGGDLEAVHGAPGECFEDEHVEGAFDESELVGGVRHPRVSSESLGGRCSAAGDMSSGRSLGLTSGATIMAPAT